jgi:hypothetical protein
MANRIEKLFFMLGVKAATSLTQGAIEGRI